MSKLLEIVSEGNRKVSSKRVVTITCLTFMLLAFLGDLFFDLTVEEFMYDSLQFIVIAGLGFTASEKLPEAFRALKGNHTPPEVPKYDEINP